MLGDLTLGDLMLGDLTLGDLMLGDLMLGAYGKRQSVQAAKALTSVAPP
jgi:hypothetical protein